METMEKTMGKVDLGDSPGAEGWKDVLQLLKEQNEKMRGWRGLSASYNRNRAKMKSSRPYQLVFLHSFKYYAIYFYLHYMYVNTCLPIYLLD